MKTSTFIFLMTLISVQSFSQEIRNKLSVNPGQLFVFSMTNFEYERGFNNGKLGVSFFLGTTNLTVRPIGGLIRTGTEQNFNLKFYSKSFSTSSFWYGGQLSVASGSIYEAGDFWNNRASGLGTVGISGKLGYQFLIQSFYLDFYGGVGYAITNNLFGQAQYIGRFTESRLLIPYGIKMGIAF